MSGNVKVSLLGRTYTLRSQQSEEQIGRVVDFVEQRIAEMGAGPSVDTRDLTALALLNLAGQYLQMMDESGKLEQIPARLELINDKIERQLNDNSGC